MNTSSNKIYSSPWAVLQTALVFVLSVMLLVVSCPLKLVLQKDFVSKSSSPVRTNQTNINQATASDYTSTDGCEVKQKAKLTKFNESHRVKIPAFTNLSYISNQAGFGLHHFLSGISFKNTFLSKSIFPSLPLFLQHLRLLI